MMIDVQGNEGSIDGDRPAASRYVETRLSKNSEFLVGDLIYDPVEMVLNFDDTKYEPTVLPARIPTCLLMGSTGIAAGYATEIPTFNLNEIVDACIYRLKHKKMSIDDLMEIVKGPDFPTGGYIIGENEIRNTMKTGRGKVINSCLYKLETTKKCNQMIISEIPFDTIKQDLVREVNNLNKDFILECRDESDKEGIRIVIDIDKKIDTKTAVDYILKNTHLRKNYNFNMVAIVDKTPKQCGVLDIIDCWINFRKEVVVKKYQYLLEKDSKRKEIIEGLIKASSIMDKVIKTIRESKDKEDVVKNLIKIYKFTQVQSEAIANMRLYRLSNTDILALQSELKELEKRIIKTNKILSSEKEVINEIVKELTEINKNCHSPRRTKIISEIKTKEIDESKLIQNEDVYLVITRDGYLKRLKKECEEQTLKEDDEIIWKGMKNTHDKINIFTDKGGYLSLLVHRIPECKANELGTHYTQFVKASDHKFILAGEGIFLCWTDDGYIKLVNSEDLVEITKLINIPIYFKTKSNVHIEPLKKDLIVTMTQDHLNKYPVSEITPVSLTSIGLQACKIKKGNSLLEVYQVNAEDKKKIDKLSIDEIKESHRGYVGQQRKK